MALGTAAPEARVIEAGTLAAAARAAAETPELALITLDLKMPGAVGYSGIALLHAERPDVPILVVSATDTADAADEARAFGAVGFLRKDADLPQIEAAIRTAMGATQARTAAPSADATPVERVRGTVAGLTPTQLKVLLAVLHGKLNKQIAFDLGMSEATVKAHMTAIMRKLDVQIRTQAALAARSLGLDLAL